MKLNIFSSAVLLLVLCGSLIVQAKTTDKSAEDDKEGGGPAAVGAGSGAIKNKASKYVEFAKKGQAKVQGQADKNFAMKNATGVEIQKAGAMAEVVGKKQGEKVALLTEAVVMKAIDDVDKANDNASIYGDGVAADKPEKPEAPEMPEKEMPTTAAPEE